MILDALNAAGHVRLIEFVLDVPAQRSVLAALLQDGVQEGHGVDQQRPGRRRRVIEQILRDVGEGALETGADALRRLVGELNGRLQQAAGEAGVHFGGDPQPEGRVDQLAVHQRVQDLFAEGQIQVTVLQQEPVARRHRIQEQPASVQLLTLSFIIFS